MALVGVSAAPKSVLEAVTGPTQVECRLDDGSTLHLPAFLGKFIKSGDVVRMLPPKKDDLLVERLSSRSRPLCLLYTTIGYVAQPRLTLLWDGQFNPAHLCSAWCRSFRCSATLELTSSI
jgi:hypothetical protein